MKSTEQKLTLGLAALVGAIAVVAAILWKAEGSESISPVGSERGELVVDDPGVLPAGGETEREALSVAEEPADVHELEEGGFLGDFEEIWLVDEEVEPLPPLRGRVVDVQGYGVPDVPVLYVPFGQDGEGLEPVLSDAGGWFVFENPHLSGQIDAAGDEWVTLFQPRLLNRKDHRAPVLVVARSIAIEGVVRDGDDVPLDGARVQVRNPDNLRAGLDFSLEESHSPELFVTADDEGRFAFPSIPAVAGAELVTRRAGFEDDRRALPAASVSNLVIELEPAEDVLGILRGRVVDGEGAAVDEAWVSLDRVVARAGAGGEFELYATRDRDRVLFAAAPGYLPTSLRGHPTGPLAGAFSDPLVLVLEKESGRLSGRVLRADGSPAAWASVWTPDTTHFGSIPIDPEQHDIAFPRTVESMASGDGWHTSNHTDWEGNFELRGLLDHAYVVCAFDFDTLGYGQSAPAQPGTEVIIRFPASDAIPRIAGIVRSFAGHPVAGANVNFGIDAKVVPSLAGREPDVERKFGRQVTTDEEGRFEARGLPRAVRWIQIEGGEIAETFRGELDPATDLTALEFRLALRCRMQVVTAGAPHPDELFVLDEEGEALSLRIKRGWVESARERWRLTDGRSEIIKTDERARTLVLRRGGKEVLRVPLQLVPGELTVLRP